MSISIASRQRIRQRARRLWIRGGWHPPTHDPQQSKSSDDARF